MAYETKSDDTVDLPKPSTPNIETTVQVPKRLLPKLENTFFGAAKSTLLGSSDHVDLTLSQCAVAGIVSGDDLSETADYLCVSRDKMVISLFKQLALFHIDNLYLFLKPISGHPLFPSLLGSLICDIGSEAFGMCCGDDLFVNCHLKEDTYTPDSTPRIFLHFMGVNVWRREDALTHVLNHYAKWLPGDILDKEGNTLFMLAIKHDARFRGSSCAERLLRLCEGDN